MKFESQNGTLEISLAEMEFLGREMVMRLIKEMQPEQKKETIDEKPKLKQNKDESDNEQELKIQKKEKKNVINPDKPLKPYVEESECEPEIKAPKRKKEESKKKTHKKKHEVSESENESESESECELSENEGKKKFDNVDISKLFGNRTKLTLPK